ncbi:MAG: hypothetical protein RSA29_06085 [Clostridium sp.]
MINNLKLKISNDAFSFLENLLMFHNEYDCVSLSENTSSNCCKSPNIDIILDNAINNDITENINGLKICHSINLEKNFKEITIVLKDNILYLKSIPTSLNNLSKSLNCSSCSKCSGCKCKTHENPQS